MALISFTSTMSKLVRKTGRKKTPEHKGLSKKGDSQFYSYLNTSDHSEMLKVLLGLSKEMQSVWLAESKEISILPTVSMRWDFRFMRCERYVHATSQIRKNTHKTFPSEKPDAPQSSLYGVRCLHMDKASSQWLLLCFSPGLGNIISVH